jgi:hypothetical protein
MYLLGVASADLRQTVVICLAAVVALELELVLES